MSLLCPIRPSTAPLLRRAVCRRLCDGIIFRRVEKLIDCRVGCRPLQEKNAVADDFSPPRHRRASRRRRAVHATDTRPRSRRLRRDLTTVIARSSPPSRRLFGLAALATAGARPRRRRRAVAPPHCRCGSAGSPPHAPRPLTATTDAPADCRRRARWPMRRRRYRAARAFAEPLPASSQAASRRPTRAHGAPAAPSAPQLERSDGARCRCSAVVASRHAPRRVPKCSFLLHWLST
jgi:hypothetical protein